MYKLNSEKNLESIKKRMDWQLAIQTGTLIGIAKLNSAVNNQTSIILDELKIIQDINITGFQDIEVALNSLESSLITGFEDLKWYLGSIDDKLAKVVGLIEFPKSTESTEQYLFGMELYKKEYYEKSIISFTAAVDKNPLNLNAIVGLYLALKEKDKKGDSKLLEEIIHLTDSNFTINTDVSDTAKNNSIIFFSNFAFNELTKLGKYDQIIDCFDNHLVDIAKKELNIRIRYIASKINTNKDYDSDLRIIVEEGNLMPLLCFIEYKENDKFVNFLLRCSDILSETFSKFSSLDFSNNDELCIKRAASVIVNSMKDEKQLIKLASVNSALSFKYPILNNFFEKAAEATNLYEVEKRKLSTASLSIEKLKKNKGIIYEQESNEYLVDSNKKIRKEINQKLNKFKKERLYELEKNVKSRQEIINKFETTYPALEEEEQESFDSIISFLKYVDFEKQNVDFENYFKEIVVEQSETARLQLSIKNNIEDIIDKAGKPEAINMLKEKLNLSPKEAKDLLDKYLK